MNHAAFIAIDPVRNAIHFDPITVSLDDGDDSKRRPKTVSQYSNGPRRSI